MKIPIIITVGLKKSQHNKPCQFVKYLSKWMALYKKN